MLVQPGISIGLFYGSSTCYTEMVAERIQGILGTGRVHLHNIQAQSLERMLDYPLLLFGAPTWDYGELQEDWDQIWDDLDQIDLNGHTCAIFGLGDQIGYPQWFQDSIGYLYHQLQSMGGQLIGHWPNSGYTFEASKALTEDGQYFLGLALDEENQPEQTEPRLQRWLQQLQKEFTTA